MTKGPEGCGVEEHLVTCLCDVDMSKSEQRPFLAIPHEMPNGEALAYFGKWDGTLLHWFELCDIAWPAIKQWRHEQSNPPPPPLNSGAFKRTLPDDVYEYLVNGIREGVSPTPLRNEIIERFQYTINKSYVTKLRQRLEARGEL